MVLLNLSNVGISRYELDTILNEYILFHYGTPAEQFPFDFVPKDYLRFPVRCVTECLDFKAPHLTALDLGCAVGRSTFELGRHCGKVVGVDLSHAFISAAKEMQKYGKLEFTMVNEGGQKEKRVAVLPKELAQVRVEFMCKDVMELPGTLGQFDVVLAANLLCRVHDPQAFLELLPNLVAKGGQLILTSPYSWLDEFTPRDKWLLDAREHPLKSIQNILSGHFQLVKSFDMPFVMREHHRKYQFVVAQASLWRKI